MSRLYIWGNNSTKILAVHFFVSKNIEISKVAAGTTTFFALSTTGEIYDFNFSTFDAKLKPMRIVNCSQKDCQPKIVSIAASSHDFLLALDDEGHVFKSRQSQDGLVLEQQVRLEKISGIFVDSEQNWGTISGTFCRDTHHSSLL